MYTKILLLSILIILGSCSSAQVTSNKSLSQTTYPVKEWLGYRFGTILKLQVQLFDGEQLNDKYHQSDFLFEVISINDSLLPKPIIIEFEDETGKYPKDDFELYKSLYGKEGELDEKKIKEIRSHYFGRKFNIVAYETGQFRGAPHGYFDYQPLKQDISFSFRNYLIVIADKTESK